jgi:hypothetical protein
MTTTTKLADYLGRWLSNGTPGTTAATDDLGRQVVTGDKDFLGRGLTVANPAVWVKSTAYAAGVYCRGAGGQLVFAATAGTSGSGSEPTWPSVHSGQKVTDGTVVWVRVL